MAWKGSTCPTTSSMALTYDIQVSCACGPSQRYDRLVQAPTDAASNPAGTLGQSGWSDGSKTDLVVSLPACDWRTSEDLEMGCQATL